MQLNRIQNAKRNIIWGIINNVIKIAFPFIIRTIIIYRLGVNYVGLNSLFTSLLSALSLAELGFDTAIVSIMYKGVAKNDFESLKALLRFVKYAYNIIGCVILIAGCCCLPFLQYFINDSSSIPENINLKFLFLLFLTNTVVSYLFGRYRTCIVQAYQRQDIITNINSICSIFFFIVQIVALILTNNYYIYVILMICTTISINICTWIVASRNYKEIYPCGKLEKEQKNKLKKILYGSFISKIGSVLSTSFDNIVISSLLGLTMLAYYSNYSYIVAALQGFFVIIYTAIQAGIGNSIALDSVEKNFWDMLKFSFAYNWIVGWCSICLIYLFEPFITIWIGEENTLPFGVTVLIVLYFYIVLCGGIQGTYKNALGIWWEDRYRCLIGGLVNLSLNIILVLILKKYSDYYALAGVVISTILSDVFILTPWSIKVTFDKYFKKGMCVYVKHLITYFMCTIVNAVLCYPLMSLISIYFQGHVYVILILRAICLIIFPNFIYLLMYRKHEQFKIVKDFLRTLVKFNY